MDPKSRKKRTRTRTFRGTRAEAEAELQRFRGDVTPFGVYLDRALDGAGVDDELRRIAGYLAPLRPLPLRDARRAADLIDRALVHPPVAEGLRR